MAVLESDVVPGSEAFQANAARMAEAVGSFRAVEARVEAAAQEARARYAKRKMLLPRDRLALLLDPGAAFLEICALAGYMRYGDMDGTGARSEEHTSELQSRPHLVCRLLLEKKKAVDVSAYT